VILRTYAGKAPRYRYTRGEGDEQAIPEEVTAA
jgi:hypothetical protein